MVRELAPFGIELYAEAECGLDTFASPYCLNDGNLSDHSTRDGIVSGILHRHLYMQRLLGFRWRVGFAKTIRRHLMRECKQAWLEWQRLPGYAKDPAAKERFTDEEVDWIVEDTSNSSVNAYTRKRNARWIQWHEEFTKAGEAQPIVAIIERWNALSDAERFGNRGQ